MASSACISAGIVLLQHRRWLLLSAAGAALCTVASPAACAADNAAKPDSTTAPAPTNGKNGEILVSGARIPHDGYSAPAPVIVITSNEIRAGSSNSLADVISTLPSARGSNALANTNGALANGAAGINNVNLRNLGASRTLVLFDGKRSVASTTTGQVDVNTFPQALIDRAEVSTGGSTSTSGSDAMAGVVNFALDKQFTGFDLEAEHGVTTYGDGPSFKISAAGGQSYLDDRLHLIVAAEYSHQTGIQSIDRDWNDSGYFTVNNPQYSIAACTDGLAATICYPEYFITSGAGSGTFTPGGLINSGVLKGTWFGTIDPATGKATVNQLSYGQTAGQWMIGGDYNITSEHHRSSATLQPEETRHLAFGRLSFEVSSALTVYGQVSASRYNGVSFTQQTPNSNVTIAADNAFLPDAVRSVMAANNLKTIAMGTSNLNMGRQGTNNTRDVSRYLIGVDGRFPALGADWTYEAYYQFGLAQNHDRMTGSWNLARMSLANDAVLAPDGNALGVPAGTIACRSTLTAPTNGCVPLNRIGIGGASEAAIAYVRYDGLQPARDQRLTQTVAAISLSTGNLFLLPAGPVALGLGGEFRQEAASGTVDPLFQPIFSKGIVSSSWITGNFLATNAKYSIAEAFAQIQLPVFAGADFNGAVRVIDYSTSGTAIAWKAGLTAPIGNSIRLRGYVSRDIRAPNMQEMFFAGSGRNTTVNVPSTDSSGKAIIRTDPLNEFSVGNSALRPEVAKSFGLGFVIKPEMLPGLALSVDYFKLFIAGSIATLTSQVLVDQCYGSGVQNACSLISTSGGRGVVTPGLPIVSIELKPSNFAGISTRGIDFDGTFHHKIGHGTFSLRALAAYSLGLKTDNGFSAVTDDSGQNTGSLPRWTFRFTAGYEFAKGLTLQLAARGVSGGVYNNNYVVCSADCPASSTDFHTINYNHIAGAFYFDLNASVPVRMGGARAEAFLGMKNLLNKNPVLVALGPTGNSTAAQAQTNRALYDVLGRVFRMGLRIKV